MKSQQKHSRARMRSVWQAGLLGALLLAAQTLSAETQPAKTPVPEPRSRLETSCQENSNTPALSEEQLSAIDAVIDSLHSAWQEEAAGLERQAAGLAAQSATLAGANEALKKEAASLTKKKQFWMRTALYEACIIAAGAAVLYASSR